MTYLIKSNGCFIRYNVPMQAILWTALTANHRRRQELLLVLTKFPVWLVGNFGIPHMCGRYCIRPPRSLLQASCSGRFGFRAPRNLNLLQDLGSCETLVSSLAELDASVLLMPESLVAPRADLYTTEFDVATSSLARIILCCFHFLTCASLAPLGFAIYCCY